MRIIVITVLLHLTLLGVSQRYKGQTTEIDNVNNLTYKQLRVFQKQTLKKINEFQGHLSFIASKDFSKEDKEIYVEVALSNFINKGKGVYMEISSKSLITGHEKIINRSLITYLKRLSQLNYAKVNLKSAKSCIVSNFMKFGRDNNGNPIYRATATYYQEFIGYFGDGRAKYRDITKKTVEIELRRTTDLHGSKWVVLLGDIKVADTTI